MPARKLTEEESVSGGFRTRELFDLDDESKPKYLSSSTPIKGQNPLEHGSKLIAKPHGGRNVFSSTERPRSVSANNNTPTPSWFRYANIDGPGQSYAPMPPGYQWEVDYYRREDGVLITKPGLARLPSPDLQPRKKPRLDDYARSLGVDIEDLTDCGIEDISSDEEMYNRRCHIFDAEDDEMDCSSLSIGRVRPAPTLLPRKQPRNLSPSTTASVVSLAQTPDSSLPPPTPIDSMSIMAPELKSYASPQDHRKRIDSRHPSLTPTSSELEEVEDGIEDDLDTDSRGLHDGAQDVLAEPEDNGIQPFDIDDDEEVEGRDGDDGEE